MSLYPGYYDIRPEKNWPRILGVSLAIVILLLFVTDCCVGCYQGKWKPFYAKVHDKEHKVWTTTDDDGNKTTHHTWILKVMIAGERWENVEVSERNYNSLCTGDHIRLISRTGGITGWTYNYSFDSKVNPKDIPGEGQ